jgi:hypothetical protein
VDLSARKVPLLGACFFSRRRDELILFSKTTQPNLWRPELEVPLPDFNLKNERERKKKKIKNNY